MNSIRLKLFTAISTFTVITLASCSNTEDGQGNPATDTPPPIPSEATSETSVDTELLAPPVNAPKEVSDLDPCAFLEPNVATQIGYSPEGQPEDVGAGGCKWVEAEYDTGGIIAFATIDSGGLSSVYSQRDSFTDFREFTVAGYPAVQATFGGVTESSCVIHVGVSDAQYLSFDSTLAIGQDADPCTKATVFAEALTPTLPAAN